MNTNELVGKIQNGEMDQELRRIKEACEYRLKVSKKAKLEPGAIVRITNTRPKYLCGHNAIVNSVNQETVTVTFDPPVRNGNKVWRSGVRVPLSCLEVVAGSNATPGSIAKPMMDDLTMEQRREAAAMRREAAAEMAFERRANRF